jgi:sugar phosphate permease
MGKNEPTDATQAEAPQRPSRVRFQVLLAACSVAVVAYVHRVGFAAVAPELKDYLCLNDRDMGYLLAVFLLAYGGFEVPGGLLSDRLGVRHVLTLLVLGWSLMTGCIALVVFLPAVMAVQFGFLLALRFLFGMFQAGGFPALARVMADWMPVQERATAQGLIWTASRLGGALAPLFLAALIVQCESWQLPLLIVAYIGFLWCAAFWPWFRDKPEEMPQVNAAELAVIAAGRRARPAHAHLPWSRMLSSRSVWALCLMYGCGGFAANFFVTWLPTYLRSQRKLTADETKWLASLPLACGVVACVLGGVISDWIIRRWGNRKWGRRLNGTVGMALGSLAWLGLNAVQGTWALAALLCLIFFLNDLAMGPAWASCTDIGERYAGTLGGAMNMVGNIAGAAGNLVAGYLFHLGNPQLVFLIYACSFALGSLCWLGVDVTKPLSAESR